MKKILLLSMLFFSIGLFAQTTKTTYYEFKINIKAFKNGDDILKLGSDIIINTKTKTLEYTEHIPVLEQDVTYEFTYKGYSEDGVVVTVNYKFDTEYASMGTIMFNNLTGDVLIIPSDTAGAKRKGSMYKSKISAREI